MTEANDPALVPMVKVRDLRREFAGRPALDGLTFSIQFGEIVGFLGENGAGKSTCLRVLACLLPPSSGSVQVQGLDLVEASVSVRRKLAYLPETVPLYPEMRVDEYLLFRARLKGVARRERAHELARVRGLCGLEERGRAMIRGLSRGYRQRVGLADALLGDPPFLLLDEPTTGLDPNQTRQLHRVLETLAGEHTILLSTHQLGEAARLCQRVLVVHHGRLLADGPPDRLGRDGESLEQVFVRLTGGSGPAAEDELSAASAEDS